MIGVLLVHQAETLLGRPYWLDESWVAVSVKAPLSDLPWVTASTPLGWTLLLHVVGLLHLPLRLLPLGFHAAAVVTAVAFGAALSGRRRVLYAAVLGALVLLAPMLVERGDLKQYTADAFLVCLTALLVVRLEERWTEGRLAALAAIPTLGMLLSHTAAFASASALLAVAATALVRRDRRRLLAAIVAGTCAVVVSTLVYTVVDRPTRTGSLDAYWHDFWLPRSPGAAAQFLARRAASAPELLGLPSWWLLAPLLTIGVAALVVLRRPATAAYFALVGLVAVVAGAVHAYPLLDVRTSTYLYTAALLVVGVAIAALADAAARVRPHAAAAVLVLAALVLAPAVVRAVRSIPVPGDGVPTATVEVARRVQPDDVVLVDLGASWGFAWSWDRDAPHFRRNGGVATGFSVDYPIGTRVIVMQRSDATSVERALADACALAGRTGTVWRLREHAPKDELRGWRMAEAMDGVRVERTAYSRLDGLLCGRTDLAGGR